MVRQISQAGFKQLLLMPNKSAIKESKITVYRHILFKIWFTLYMGVWYVLD